MKDYRGHEVSQGYYDWRLGKFGEMPDDPDALKRGLRRALIIIGAYELDCRNIEHYVSHNPTGQGFCQGEVYREAVADIFASMEKQPVA